MFSEAILQKGAPPITRDQAAQMFPLTHAPYAVWFNSDDDEGNPPWAVNGADGNAMLDVSSHEEAAAVASALKLQDALSSEMKKTSLINDELGTIALEATWEIEGLTNLIVKELEECPEVENLALRGIALRVKRLNSVIMSAIGDSPNATSDDLASLRKRMVSPF